MKKIFTVFFILAISLNALVSQNPSNALTFDGIDDYVSVPNGTGIVSGLSAFSMWDGFILPMPIPHGPISMVISGSRMKGCAILYRPVEWHQP